jgi:histone chaperone ASF1
VLKIPVVDALGVTVVLLTCSYRQQEFVRVGYFINNEYTEPELRENPPAQPQFDKVSIVPHGANNNSRDRLSRRYVSLGT